MELQRDKKQRSFFFFNRHQHHMCKDAKLRLGTEIDGEREERQRRERVRALPGELPGEHKPC